MVNVDVVAEIAETKYYLSSEIGYSVETADGAGALNKKPELTLGCRGKPRLHKKFKSPKVVFGPFLSASSSL